MLTAHEYFSMGVADGKGSAGILGYQQGYFMLSCEKHSFALVNLGAAIFLKMKNYHSYDYPQTVARYWCWMPSVNMYSQIFIDIKQYFPRNTLDL